MKQFASSRAVLTGLLVANSLTYSSISLARETGTDIETCNGCHEHGDPPTAEVSLDRQQVQPGETVKFTLDAASENMISGFLALAPGGEFTVPDAEFQRHVSPNLITHVKPKPYVDGKVVWEFEWTAPTEVGVSIIQVSTVAGNGNQMPGDDGAALLQTWVSHGCEALEYFIDIDKDGYGDASRIPKPSCTPIENHVANGLDCADDDPLRNPDAMEACNSLDDNCDGTVDENLDTAVLYPDGDGDGYGTNSAGGTLLDCPPVVGYAKSFDDCDDNNAQVNPGAAESCNGIDDNCNNKVDEDPMTSCGVGACEVLIAGCDMVCTPGTPTAEICNEVDDDCDGVVDNDCTMAGGAGGAGPAPASSAGASPVGPSNSVGPKSSCAAVRISGAPWIGLLGGLGVLVLSRVRRRRAFRS